MESAGGDMFQIRMAQGFEMDLRYSLSSETWSYSPCMSSEVGERKIKENPGAKTSKDVHTVAAQQEFCMGDPQCPVGLNGEYI